MSSESDTSPESDAGSRIHADEDWKERVKAENAALDASLKAEASAAAGDEAAPPSDQPDEAPTGADKTAEQPADDYPLPPATFEVLVSMFSTQAMVGLGILPNPASGKPQAVPNLAKHFIDLLGMLETKTAGNLEAHEQALLDSSLHQLRMAYVQVMKKPEMS
jgi:hypothetical protein